MNFYKMEKFVISHAFFMYCSIAFKYLQVLNNFLCGHPGTNFDFDYSLKSLNFIEIVIK